jgi:hypothetical protein
MTAWYRTGTVAVENASTTVTGSLTAWLMAAKAGDAFVGPDAARYEITAVTSNTEIEIYPAYAGSTASGQSYAIERISTAWNSVSELSVTIAETAEAFQRGFSMTSMTSVEIGDGPHELIVPSGMPILPGARVLISSRADPSTHWILGLVTAYEGQTLTVAEESVGTGSGDSRSDWNINIAGIVGPQGPPGLQALPLPAYTGVVASKCRVPTKRSSTNKQMMSRSRHFARDDIRSLQVVFANWYVDDSTKAETNAGDTATLTASIEYPEGTCTALKFSGTGSVTMSNGGTSVSDALDILIPDGAEFWVRSFYDAATNARIIWSSNRHPEEQAAYGVSGVSDMTAGGNITDGGADAIYRPVAIIGTTQRPSVLLLGDSRVEGIGDTVETTGNGDVGNLERSISPRWGTINAGKSGNQATQFVSSHTKRVDLAQYCSHVVAQFGIVDLVAGRSPAQVKTDLETIIGYFTVPVWIATVEPITTSSDSWATTGNQTLDGGNTDRITLNTAIRGGSVSGAAGYFEIADALESARDSGKWKVTGAANGYTADGTHSNQAGYKLIRTLGVVDPNVFSRIASPSFATPTQVAAREGGNVVVSPETLLSLVGGIETFTPTVRGSSTAGSATYSLQTGYTIKVGNLVFFYIAIAYSGHTGTGNFEIIGMPYDTSVSPCPIIINAANLTFTNQLAGTIRTGPFVRLETLSTGAANAALAIDAAATLILAGVYPTN